MSAGEYKRWQEYMGYTNIKAAEKLGLSVSGIEKYRRAGVKSKTVVKLMDILETVHDW